MAGSLAPPDKNPVAVIRLDTAQTAEVSQVGINGVYTGKNLKPSSGTSLLIHAGEFISDMTATLPETYNQ
jgi:hypothetical protein